MLSGKKLGIYLYTHIITQKIFPAQHLNASHITASARLDITEVRIMP